MIKLTTLLVAITYCYAGFSQNVGIGTASPINRLDVNGSLSIGSAYISSTAPSNGAIIQGQVAIGQSATPNTALQLVTNGNSYAANQITCIPLYAGYGGPPTVSSGSSTQFGYVQAGFVPTAFRTDGYVQVQLVVYYTTSAGSNNFQLDASNGGSMIYPITCSGCGGSAWTYSGVGSGVTVATSPWTDWNAGTSAYQVHLEGFTSGYGTISVYNAYLLVRPKNN